MDVFVHGTVKNSHLSRCLNTVQAIVDIKTEKSFFMNGLE